MLSASSILAFWRARPRLEKAVAVLVVAVVLLEALRRPSFLVGPVEIAALIAGLALALRYLRAALAVLMWRLRHRLLITYLFIGVIPVLLLLTMAGLAANIFYGQVATYLVGDEIERVKQELDVATRSTAHDIDAALHDGRDTSPAAALTLLRFHLPERLADLDLEVSQLRQRPAWIAKEFYGLVWSDGRYVVRAAAPSSHGLLIASLPVDVPLLDRLAKASGGGIKAVGTPGIGTLRFVAPSGEAGDAGLQTGQPGPGLPVGNYVYNLDGGFQGGVLPPPENRFDFNVKWMLSAETVDWETGQAHAPAVLVVSSRPSLMNARLFNTLDKLSRLPLSLLAAAAVAFLVIELLSLLIGVRLTRTMTRAVADLYEGTQRVHAADFSWRIPVRSRDQLASLADSFNTMTASIKQLIEEQKEKQRLQFELDVARDVQAQLFPKEVPALKRLQLTGSCSPARTVSGDYYDFVALDDRNLALVIGDVAGKGISAALLMASIQSMLHTQFALAHDSLVRRATAVNGGEGPMGSAEKSMATLVGQLNRQLYENIAKGHFATFYCALYDDESGQLTYTNAGHPPPMILRRGQVHRLEKGGVVLGIFPAALYEQETVCLESGDLLLAFTDGITEPENLYGEEFGEQRLLAVLRRNTDRPVAEIVSEVMAAVRDWTGSPELQDDMTLVLARRL